jgi:hypothetical protein
MMARGQAAGRPVGTMDALIAATAEQHGLTLVTRNVADFDPLERFGFSLNRMISVIMTHVVIARSPRVWPKASPRTGSATWRSIAAHP